MNLPTVPLPEGSVEINGEAVVIHSLTRTQVVTLIGMEGDQTAGEVFLVAKGTGATDEEAGKWLDSVDADTANKLLQAIAVLSGVGPAGKGPTGN